MHQNNHQQPEITTTTPTLTLRQDLSHLELTKKLQSKTRKAQYRIFAILVILIELLSIYQYGIRKDGSVGVILFGISIFIYSFLKPSSQQGRRTLDFVHAKRALDRAVHIEQQLLVQQQQQQLSLQSNLKHRDDSTGTHNNNNNGIPTSPTMIANAMKERAVIIGKSVADTVKGVKRGVIHRSISSPATSNNNSQQQLQQQLPILLNNSNNNNTNTTTTNNKTILYDSSKTFHGSPGLRLNSFAGLKNIDFKTHAIPQLTPKQRELYDQFNGLVKTMVKELRDTRRVDESRFFQSPDDFTKLRFLQSDGYDVKKALVRLTETLIWRNRIGGIDDFITTPHLALLDRYKALRVRRMVGLDKKGRPLLCERLGALLNGSEVLNKGLLMEDIIQCYSYDISEIFAAFRESCEIYGIYQHRVVYIGDLAGMKSMAAIKMIGFLRTLASSVERHFVELAGPLFLINAPYMAPKIWQMIKPFIDPQTANQICIVAGPARELLIEEFGAEVVPMEWGGLNPYQVPHSPEKLTEEFDKRYPYQSAHVPRTKSGSFAIGRSGSMGS
jgi:hypothetical protein